MTGRRAALIVLTLFGVVLAALVAGVLWIAELMDRVEQEKGSW